MSDSTWDRIHYAFNTYSDPVYAAKEMLACMVDELRERAKELDESADEDTDGTGARELANRLEGLLENFAY